MQTIAARLAIDVSLDRRRVIRHERTLREQTKVAPYGRAEGLRDGF